MRIQVRKGFSVAVLEMEGRFTAGQGVECLKREVDAILGQGVANIILNMSQVELIDCAGIGQLVQCYNKSREQGGSLKLVKLQWRLGQLLRMFRLDSQLEVFDTETAAVAAIVGSVSGVPGASESSPKHANGGCLAEAKCKISFSDSGWETASKPSRLPWTGGDMIGHYRLAHKIGEGGAGVVYKAYDTRLDRTVALKFLRNLALGTMAEKARFLREAQVAAALNHPNVCTVHEICEVEEQVFIVMEYLEGEDLRQKIQRRHLMIQEALDLAIEIGSGLKAVHDRRVVHRDVKSANIMILPGGHPKIMDFGLAHLVDCPHITASGATLGTPAYMSPEQARGDPVNERADIWSLGVVLYEMVSGRLPFRGQNAQAVLFAILNEEPERLSSLRSGLPAEMDRVAAKALAKDPTERYQHMDELILDLKRLRAAGCPASRSLGGAPIDNRAFSCGA
jgi:anti-anti-sigma factor